MGAASSASCTLHGEPGSPEAAAYRAANLSADTPVTRLRRRLPGAENEELIELPQGALVALAHIQDARERAKHRWQTSKVTQISRVPQEHTPGQTPRPRCSSSTGCGTFVGSPSSSEQAEAFIHSVIFEDHRIQADDKGVLLLPSRDSTLECAHSPMPEGTPAAEGTAQAACKASHRVFYSTPERGRESWMPASIMRDRCPAPPPTPQGVRVYSTPPPSRCKVDRTPCSGGVPEEGKACDVLLPLDTNSALHDAANSELDQQDSAKHAWRGLVNLSGKRMSIKSQSAKLTPSRSPQCSLSDTDAVDQENLPPALAGTWRTDFAVASKTNARSE